MAILQQIIIRLNDIFYFLYVTLRMYLILAFFPNLVFLIVDRWRVANYLENMKIFQACLKNETINSDPRALLK